MNDKEKLQRAIALLQLAVSYKVDFFEAEQEIREQLQEWGIKVPDTSPVD